MSLVCNNPDVDVVILAFINGFPAQGDGLPIVNFGNQCGGGFYQGENATAGLPKSCPYITEQIPICQANGKKVLISLGGASGPNSPYDLEGEQNGIDFANWLWGAYGPYDPTWVANGGIRPLDPVSGNPINLDGFDFDIERTNSGKLACAF